MKTKNLLILLLIGFSTSLNAQITRVMTYNIRYDSKTDTANTWANRKMHVCDLLRFHEPDIFGLQEAFYNQVTDVSLQLPRYDHIGVGQADGRARGEYTPIFYDSRKFQLKDQGWFWLSEMPNIPSRGWDAASNKICTYVLLEDYDKHRSVWVFNTQLDQIGLEAQANSVKLIMQKIDSLNTKKYPVILMGDFNITPDAKPIARLESVYYDCSKVTEQAPYGPEGTYNGFDMDSDLKKRIDYLFVKGRIEVKKYGVLTDTYNHRYPSDHLPVLIEVIL